MPWPGTFQNILGSVDISVLNVATRRTDMGTHRKRLLDHLTTAKALLRGVAGVHSNHLMSGACSLGSENVEERTPGGVHDAFSEIMILNHRVDGEFLDGDELIVLSVGFGRLEVEVTALPLDLQVGLRGALRGLTTALRAFLATGDGALLTSECGLTLAVVAGVLNGVAKGVGQEDFQSYVNADIRMGTFGRSMLTSRFRLTHDEGVPMPIGPMHQ